MTPTSLPGRARGHLRRRVAALAALLMALLLTAACTAGTAGGGGAGNESAGDMSKSLKYFPCCAWGTTWSFNPYNVNGLNMGNDFITLRLGIQKYPSLTDYEPQLSDRWEVADGKITVHLREDAKWQDDTPLTAKDLYDTTILNGLRGDGLWKDLTNVEQTDDHTVVYTVREGSPITLVLGSVMGIHPYQSAIFGKFATDSLKADLLKYFDAVATDPEAAGKLPEFKRIGDGFKDLAAFKPDKLMGNGPFKLDNITTKEAKLTKWDGFYGADKIKFGGIQWSNGANQIVYPQLFAQNTDFSNVYMPPPLLKRWQSTPNSNLALPPAFGFVLGFNSAKAPFDKKQVRQALAYVIPRQQMSEAAYGTEQGAGGAWKEVNTGIPDQLEKIYLKPEQVDTLNKYPVDPAKATELLQGQGFTQKDGQWYQPNGKRFTMTLTVNADTSDIVTSFNSAAKALTAFGIKSDVKATSGAQQDADQHNGDFDAGMFFIGGSNPLGMYSAMLGPGYNFTAQGNYAGKRGIGFGPQKNVPGLGEVDVASTIDQQARTIEPGDEMNAQVWNWAQLVNDEVPYIWYATKVYQFSYSTKNFENWPEQDDSGTSALWNIIGNDLGAGLSLAVQQGYIVPKG